MLAADKSVLEATIRQSATSLKEKEFLLHHENLMTVGTQAAVLAGFTVTALIEFGPPENANRFLKFCYYNMVMLSLSANILCVVKTTCLSVVGTGLAMRGPEGSVKRAVDGIFKLRQNVFLLFGVGMMSLLFMGIFGSWLILDALTALCATAIFAGAIYMTYLSYGDVTTLFHFDEDDAVNFDDLLARFQPPRRSAAWMSHSKHANAFDEDNGPFSVSSSSRTPRAVMGGSTDDRYGGEEAACSSSSSSSVADKTHWHDDASQHRRHPAGGYHRRHAETDALSTSTPCAADDASHHVVIGPSTPGPATSSASSRGRPP